MAESSGIQNLQGLLNLYQSAKGSSASQTTQNSVSQAGVNSTLQQILSGTNGLADVSRGQRGAGLYNSTTNQLLTNDLLARAAGEVGKLNSSTTTSTKKGGAIGGNELLAMLGMTAGKSILGPTISGMAKKYGVENWGKDLASSLGVGGSGGAELVGGSTNMFEGLNAADYLGNVSPGILDTSLSSLSDFGSSLATDYASSYATDAAADVATSAATDYAASATLDAGSSGFSDIFSNLFG